MRCQSLILALFAALTTALRSGTTKLPANAIQLSKVKTLTVRAGKQTSARRVSPIPQLKCIGGNARNLYDVDVMQCKNSGSDYGDEDIQWTCKAALPPEFKLGSTDVICEGYDSPDDPFVLKGSCGVEYRLVLTEQGEAKYGKGSEDEPSESLLSPGAGRLVFWAFCAFIAYIFIKAAWDLFTRPRGQGPPEGGAGGGGGWGGGNDDDDNNDPPPPYSARPSKSFFGQQSAGQAGNQRGWQPGLWTGAAAGAAAGYGARYLQGGRNGARNNDPQVGSSRWASGAGRPSGSTSPSPSTSRYESTGFGGTSRR